MRTRRHQMKKIVGILGVVVLFNLTGCATHDYVRSQVDPLTERLGKLESKVSQIGGAAEGDKAAIMQANDKAQQALDMANKMAGDATKADNDAKRAEDAAMKAENAAKEAERAANEAQRMENKSEKLFKLDQKK